MRISDWSSDVCSSDLHAGHRESGHGVKGHYDALGIEMAAHFVIMYLVMYTMIATLDHFYFNNNTLWMKLMMVTPMALIMMLTMRPMFPSRSLNVAVDTVAMLVFSGSFWALRVQRGIGNEEFLKSDRKSTRLNSSH